MIPFVVQISDAGVVPPSELIARIARVGALPGCLRRRYIVQLRDPDLDTRTRWMLACELRAQTRAAGCGFVCNDRLDLAIGVEADGVHLGRGSVTVAEARQILGDSALVSASAHGVDDVIAAHAARADLVLLSPIFDSPGKGAPLGVGAIVCARRVLDALPAPRPALVALGGVARERVEACLAAGAAGVAAIRADLGATLAERLAEDAR